MFHYKITTQVGKLFKLEFMTDYRYFVKLILMKWFLPIFICLFISEKVSAVDLTIYDPIVNNLEVVITASLSASSNYYLQGIALTK